MTSFSIPTLETERLILRAPRAEDFAAEADFFASDASRFVGGPMDSEQTWRAFATLLGHWALRGYGFWGLQEKSSGRYLGHVGLWNPHGWPEREIGWTLMSDATGQGFATEAAIAARAHAYDILGWPTAISLIDPENTASMAVAKRLGAAYESTYEHSRFGLMQIWRHPAPDLLVDGNPEAYA